MDGLAACVFVMWVDCWIGEWASGLVACGRVGWRLSEWMCNGDGGCVGWVSG